MIVAGFILLVVGAADLVRQFAPRRWIGYLTIAVIMLLLGSVSDALLPMLAALVIGALWVWCMPDDRPAPLGFWPAVLLGVVGIGAVVWIGARPEAGLIGEVWNLKSPFGGVSFDLAMLVVGASVFLLESSNLVVRAALDGEHTWRPIDVSRSPGPAAADTPGPAETPAAADTPGPAETPVAETPVAETPVAETPVAETPVAGDTTDAVTASALTAETGEGETSTVVAPLTDRRGGFKGGRLIGPLERMIVLILTLAGAYPLLAAMLAAKGIVRFPEISRDGETGARAEYFLVGSLVSWVISLGAAFLVWWAAHS